MPAPSQPCAPALLPVSNVPAGAPLALLNADDYIPNPPSTPSYTQLTCGIINCDPNAADGLDPDVQLATTLTDDWDVASAAQDADLDTILLLLADADPTAATQDYGVFQDAFLGDMESVGTVGALTLPDYGTLPTAWVQANSTQLPTGTVTAGSPAFTQTIVAGLPNNTLYGTPVRVALLGSPQFNQGASGPIIVSATMVSYALSADGKSWDVTIAINIDPNTAGTFQQELGIYGANFAAPELIAFYVTVNAAPAPAS